MVGDSWLVITIFSFKDYKTFFLWPDAFCFLLTNFYTHLHVLYFASGKVSVCAAPAQTITNAKIGYLLLPQGRDMFQFQVYRYRRLKIYLKIGHYAAALVLQMSMGDDNNVTSGSSILLLTKKLPKSEGRQCIGRCSDIAVHERGLPYSVKWLAGRLLPSF